MKSIKDLFSNASSNVTKTSLPNSVKPSDALSDDFSFDKIFSSDSSLKSDVFVSNSQNANRKLKKKPSIFKRTFKSFRRFSPVFGQRKDKNTIETSIYQQIAEKNENSTKMLQNKPKCSENDNEEAIRESIMADFELEEAIAAFNEDPADFMIREEDEDKNGGNDDGNDDDGGGAGDDGDDEIEGDGDEEADDEAKMATFGEGLGAEIAELFEATGGEDYENDGDGDGPTDGDEIDLEGIEFSEEMIAQLSELLGQLEQLLIDDDNDQTFEGNDLLGFEATGERETVGGGAGGGGEGDEVENSELENNNDMNEDDNLDGLMDNELDVDMDYDAGEIEDIEIEIEMQMEQEMDYVNDNDDDINDGGDDMDLFKWEANDDNNSINNNYNNDMNYVTQELDFEMIEEVPDNYGNQETGHINEFLDSQYENYENIDNFDNVAGLASFLLDNPVFIEELEMAFGSEYDFDEIFEEILQMANSPPCHQNEQNYYENYKDDYEDNDQEELDFEYLDHELDFDGFGQEINESDDVECGSYYDYE